MHSWLIYYFFSELNNLVSQTLWFEFLLFFPSFSSLSCHQLVVFYCIDFDDIVSSNKYGLPDHIIPLRLVLKLKLKTSSSSYSIWAGMNSWSNLVQLAYWLLVCKSIYPELSSTCKCNQYLKKFHAWRIAGTWIALWHWTSLL